jgi:hypothetical protein
MDILPLEIKQLIANKVNDAEDVLLLAMTSKEFRCMFMKRTIKTDREDLMYALTCISRVYFIDNVVEEKRFCKYLKINNINNNKLSCYCTNTLTHLHIINGFNSIVLPLFTLSVLILENKGDYSLGILKTINCLVFVNCDLYTRKGWMNSNCLEELILIDCKRYENINFKNIYCNNNKAKSTMTKSKYIDLKTLEFIC